MEKIGSTVEEKIAHGLALRIAGDETGFIRVDDEIQADPVARREPAACRYHALRLAACGAALVLAGCGSVEPRPGHVYAGPPAKPVARQPVQAPRPPPSPQQPPLCVYAGPQYFGRRQMPLPPAPMPRQDGAPPPGTPR